MKSGHEGLSSRGAPRRTAVELSEFGAFAGELVEVRCLDVLLPVCAQMPITEIVCEDQDDVRRTITPLPVDRLGLLTSLLAKAALFLFVPVTCLCGAILRPHGVLLFI